MKFIFRVAQIPNSEQIIYFLKLCFETKATWFKKSTNLKQKCKSIQLRGTIHRNFFRVILTVSKFFIDPFLKLLKNRTSKYGTKYQLI